LRGLSKKWEEIAKMVLLLSIVELEELRKGEGFQMRALDRENCFNATVRLRRATEYGNTSPSAVDAGGRGGR
jgi:hypothetical protein